MTVSFDSKNTVALSTANPTTMGFTCGTKCTLLVLHVIDGANASPGGTPTFNSVNMSKVGGTVIGVAEVASELWYLYKPNTGANYVIGMPNANGDNLRLYASSYVSSVNSSLVLSVNTSTNVTVGSPSLTLTSTTADSVFVDVYGTGNTSPGKLPSGFILINSADEGIWSTMCAYKLLTSASTVTDRWPIASDDVAFILANFGETLAPATSPALVGDFESYSFCME